MVPVEKKRELDFQRAWTADVLARLQYAGWFGTVTLKVEEGRIVRLTKEESLVPPRGNG